MEFSGVWKKEYASMWKFQGQLKKKWNFRGCSRKTQVEFPWVLVFDLGLSKGCHNFAEFPGVTACFLWNF